MQIRLGIIGTGRIASRMADTVLAAEKKIVDVPESAVLLDEGDTDVSQPAALLTESDKGISEGVVLAAVYNPNITSARRFISEKGIDILATDDWQQFLSAVDAVYVASPHETHYDYAMKALLGGRHVLCEKPMCLVRTQAEELFALAKEKNLIHMEACKTAYCEGFQKVLQVERSGIIGRIYDVEACFTKLENPFGRELTDITYGGSVTELATYVLLPIMKLLGIDYQELSFQSVLGENGLDLYTKICFTYENGMAMGKVGLGVKSEGQLIIAGTKGYIRVDSPWWLTKYFTVHHEDPNQVEEYQCSFEGSGLQYELAVFADAISGVTSTGTGDVTCDGASGVGNAIGSNGGGCVDGVGGSGCACADKGLTPAESIAMAGVMEAYRIGRSAEKLEQSCGKTVISFPQ